MPRYIDVVHATQETAVKILALREGGKVAREVVVTTNGGATASVSWSDRAPLVTLNMPGLPPDAVLTRGEADRLVAFIVHECCHVLHTNKHGSGLVRLETVSAIGRIASKISGSKRLKSKRGSSPL
jgi:hypothetical protein